MKKTILLAFLALFSFSVPEQIPALTFPNYNYHMQRALECRCLIRVVRPDGTTEFYASGEDLGPAETLMSPSSTKERKTVYDVADEFGTKWTAMMDSDQPNAEKINELDILVSEYLRIVSEKESWDPLNLQAFALAGNLYLDPLKPVISTAHPLEEIDFWQSYLLRGQHALPEYRPSYSDKLTAIKRIRELLLEYFIGVPLNFMARLEIKKLDPETFQIIILKGGEDPYLN